MDKNVSSMSDGSVFWKTALKQLSSAMSNSLITVWRNVFNTFLSLQLVGLYFNQINNADI